MTKNIYMVLLLALCLGGCESERTTIQSRSPNWKKVVIIKERSTWGGRQVRMYHKINFLFAPFKEMRCQSIGHGTVGLVSERTSPSILWSKDSTFLSVWDTHYMRNYLVLQCAYDFKDPDRIIQYFEPYYDLFERDPSIQNKIQLLDKLAQEKREYVNGFLMTALQQNDMEIFEFLLSKRRSDLPSMINEDFIQQVKNWQHLFPNTSLEVLDLVIKAARRNPMESVFEGHFKK